MDALLQDVKISLRSLRKSPGFTLAAVLALAIGIGASTSIFTIVDAVLLRPLPLPEPARLAKVWAINHQGNDNAWSVRNYLDLRDETKAFQSVAAYYPLGWNVKTAEGVEKLGIGAVTDGFFRTLGVSPTLGRAFEPGEDLSGRDKVVVVSDALWRRMLGGDPAALGKAISLNERPYVLIGVLPPQFRFEELPTADAFIPIGFDDQDLASRSSHYLQVLGRLAPGATLQQANAEVKLVAEHIAGRDPNHRGWSARARDLHEQIVGPVHDAFTVLFAAVLLVMLIGCANVAGLLLARGVSRRRELAIRAALGGGRLQLVRQLLVESMLLSLLGAALGVALAAWSLDVLVALAPREVPRLAEVHLNLRVLLFALGAGLFSGVAAGVWPALQASQTDLLDAFKEGSGHASEGRSRGRARRVLVVAEIALALVLAVSAGLMGKSLKRLLDMPFGFDAGGVLTAQVGVPFTRYREGKPFADFFAALVERVSHLPGVTSAAVTSHLPLDEAGKFDNTIHVDGTPPPPPGFDHNSQLNWIAGDYWQTLRIPLRSGRLLDARDSAGAPPAIVVNEAFAKKFLAGMDPLGQRVQIFNNRWNDGSSQWRWTIVGVVADTRQMAADRDPRPEIYLSMQQQASNTAMLVVRTAGNPSALISPVRQALAALDPQIPLSRPATLEEVLARSVAGRRAEALLLGLFGGVALLLASLGIYGLIAHSVAQRTQEIGIRMALGAQPAQVLRMVLRQGLTLAALGVVSGLLLSLGATRALEGLLFGVPRTDPLTYASVAALLVGVAMLASLLPARRATRVDPVLALRAE